MDLDSVDGIVTCLFTTLNILLLELLLDGDDSVFVRTLEEDKVAFADFKVVDWLQGVDHSLATFLVDNLSFVDSSKGYDVQTGFGESNEILFVWNHEASNLTFPQLEAFVSK